MLDRLTLLVPLLPLVAALVIGSFSLSARPLGERATSRLALGAALLSSLGAAALLGRALFDGAPKTVFVAPWIESGAYRAPLELLLDPLSASLALLVAGFGALVLRFSTNYMHREAGFGRFFLVMCFFLAAMLLLVLGGNLVMTFVGWEGAGLASYLLIGYHHERKAPARSATYTFVTNRIGDAAFLGAIFVAWHELGTITYTSLFQAAETADRGALTTLGLCLLVAAAAKSAQLPFSPWISRAMEGPTPSSALFYGAVMVTAGLFLVLRVGPVLDHAPDVLHVMAAMGAATALYGGLVSLVQTDAKSGLIFSTVSQLGLMFLAVGLGARGIALFHLFTHALLRGAQFLTAPSTLRLVPRDEPSRDMELVAGRLGRGLHAAALARFWLEPLYEKCLVAPLLRLGRALDHVDTFDRGRGVPGRAVQYAASLAHLIETHLVRRAMGRGIPVTGDRLGRTLHHVEAVLERPVVVGALVLLSLFVVVRWAV
ncbi:NADH-quinone oxidoreductase subunit L [Polyangium spumosum]|uniref:NADH-quinone oxidoreductase subunit L n=1 Tax=Polyangium spumosum TaxID=889282 RepID=A0A6N7PMH2_9BACT|nr:proton-conducting transporter membrane subunit [Polyangium spumosum]MRG92016.1 hypothetical protein [Polyangium spumosum]